MRRKRAARPAYRVPARVVSTREKAIDGLTVVGPGILQYTTRAPGARNIVRIHSFEDELDAEAEREARALGSQRANSSDANGVRHWGRERNS